MFSFRLAFFISDTAWKVSKYEIFSGPHFPVFSPNTGKYRPERNSVFGHFSGCQIKIATGIKFRNRNAFYQEFCMFLMTNLISLILMEICFSNYFVIMNFKIKLSFKASFLRSFVWTNILQIAPKFEQVIVFPQCSFTRFQTNILITNKTWLVEFKNKIIFFRVLFFLCLTDQMNSLHLTL